MNKVRLLLELLLWLVFVAEWVKVGNVIVLPLVELLLGHEDLSVRPLTVVLGEESISV